MAALYDSIERAGELRFIRLLPSQLAIIEAPLAPGQATPLTSSEALARDPSVAAVLDGPMFRKCAGQPDDYRTYTCAQLEYRLLDRRAGVDVPTQHPARGFTLSVTPDGRASVADGAAVAEGAVFAAQGYPQMVRRGTAHRMSDAGSNDERVWRAGWGLLSDGMVILAVANQTMQQFADALAALSLAGNVRVTDFVYGDGGGSGRLVVRDGQMAGSSENRRVPVWIGVKRPGAQPTPPRTQPTTPGAGGGGKVAAALLAVGATIAAGYGLSRRK